MDSVIDILLSSIRLSTPLWFAAMGGLLAERSGVVNLALEGLMLLGAFTGAAVAYSSGSPLVGFLAAGLAGGILALLFGFFTLTLKGDQVVIGMGINLLSSGLTPFLNKYFFHVTSSTPSLAIEQRFVYGPTVAALALVAAISLWMRKSVSGLWLRFAGEHPEALASAGIRVKRVRWTAVILSGVLAGFGGATMATMLASSFSRQMTAGAGFMAIAALILGRWALYPRLLVVFSLG
jgi:ABC-type uncharacterized transport system permease subunit